MNTAFAPKHQCLLQSPYHFKCASIVYYVVNMTWQAHFMIVIQEEIALCILNQEITKSLILHFAQTTH